MREPEISYAGPSSEPEKSSSPPSAPHRGHSFRVSPTLQQQFKDQPRWLKVLEILALICTVIGLPVSIILAVVLDKDSSTVVVNPINPASPPPPEASPTNPPQLPTPMLTPGPTFMPNDPIISYQPTLSPVFEGTPTNLAQEPPTGSPVQSVPSVPCDSHSDCPNNACGAETLNNGASMICCPSGSYVYVSSPISKNVCQEQAAGNPCRTSNSICASDVCVEGICQETVQAEGEPCDNNGDCAGTCVNNACLDSLISAGGSCDDNDDCLNNACGAASLSNGADFICCPSNSLLYMSTPYSKNVCTGQATDQPCATTDRLCESGICATGTCQASAQGEGEACDNNGDCGDGTCVEKICTASGLVGSGGFCDDSDDCVNNACAAASLRNGADVICCPSGSYTYVSSPTSKNICTGQEAGEACQSSDSLCVSGVCAAGTCLASGQEEGGPCDNNADCGAGTCVGNICTGDGLIGPGRSCDDNGDCLNNACASTSLRNGADIICCPSGSYTYVPSPTSKNICNGQAPGDPCQSSDSLCESGVCAEQVCQVSGQAEGGPCDNNGDCDGGTCVEDTCTGSLVGPGGSCDDNGDCLNNACAFSSLNNGAKLICCPSGSSAYVSSPYSKNACTEQASGDPCGSQDSVCASGVCVEGVCE